MLGVRTLQIGPQEFFYITKGFSHVSLLDLLQDPDVRNTSNLLFPINSKEADQVELDEVETHSWNKSQVENTKAVEINGSMEVIADSVNECLYLNDNVSPFTWRVRLKGGRALEGIPE